MPAPAQTDGYPCGSKRLDIVQRGQEYAIEPIAATSGQVPVPTRAMIAIGRTLKIDRAILESAGRGVTEVRDEVRP